MNSNPASSELIQLTLTGSRPAVQTMIALLHRLNVISGSEWSQPVQLKHSQTVICVAARRVAIAQKP